MNKLLLALLVGLIMPFCSLAQEFTLGARGGLNYYNTADINSRGGSLQGTPPDELFTPNKELGTQFGVYVTVEFGKFFIQPEFNLVSSKNSYDFPIKTSYWKTKEIDIPILFGYQIFDMLSIYAGPGFNTITKTSLDGVQVTTYSDGGPDLEQSNLNANIGIKVKLNRFGFDLRYEHGLKDTDEELLDIIRSLYGVNLADSRSFTPNTISLSFTVDIISTKKADIGGFFSGLFKSDKCHCPYMK